MELVYLCTGQTATSVAVRKHTQEATAKTVKALVSRTIFSKIFLAFRIWFLLSHHSSSFYFTLTCFDKHKFFPIIINFLRCSSISVDNDCSCSSGPEGKQRCKIGQLISHLRATSSSRRPTKFAHAHAHAHTHAHTHEQAVDKLCDASMFCLMELYSEWGKGRSIEGEHAPIQAPAQTCRRKHKRGE